MQSLSRRLRGRLRAKGCDPRLGRDPDHGNTQMSHRFELRVYYEDTDLAGIVYYANYLKFVERARTEWVRDLGVDQGRLKSEAGIVFAVRRVEADYLSPARFDDVLVVETRAETLTPARVVLRQDVWRGTERLFSSLVTVVCLGDAGRPVRIPAELRQRMAAGGEMARG